MAGRDFVTPDDLAHTPLLIAQRNLIQEELRGWFGGQFESMEIIGAYMGAWQYDDEDIKRLRMIMTLHDIGFAHDEIANYMRLLPRGDSAEAERMRILKRQRDKTLDEIHFQEQWLDRPDYLRHQMRKQPEKKFLT